MTPGRLPPIAASIVNRPKPTFQNRFGDRDPRCIRLFEWEAFWSDLACWKADKAEALMSGVDETR